MAVLEDDDFNDGSKNDAVDESRNNVVDESRNNAIAESSYAVGISRNATIDESFNDVFDDSLNDLFNDDSSFPPEEKRAKMWHQKSYFHSYKKSKLKWQVFNFIYSRSIVFLSTFRDFVNRLVNPM